MTDWIKHNGGPQPVGDDVWVEAYVTKPPLRDVSTPRDGPASIMDWLEVVEYRILNQHLIDAARLEGIRLGLEAAEKYNRRAFDLIVDALRNTNPETVAKEADNEPR